ncbi:MAG: type II 3-dehydroquinate dehydratase [Sulfobacillus acidophilus]|uniref:3-dehydroquinate dehydratase n=1 Tax=Sulfobacillus acidophilus TaxID=53633 RepID=A0A2T2WPH5_9FIRM|nr:MAG: type II 3-dehydroquinate dehydratase [Sulfobacillus acidophilus]
MRQIGVMHGPNLGRLGVRQPQIYGSTTLHDLHEALKVAFPAVAFQFFQSNHEGELIDQLESWRDQGWERVVLNAGALTHQSFALRDAIESLALTVVEVHLSNIYRREPFRAHSLIAPVAVGQISGLGIQGYHLAVQYLVQMTDLDQI